MHYSIKQQQKKFMFNLCPRTPSFIIGERLKNESKSNFFYTDVNFLICFGIYFDKFV